MMDEADRPQPPELEPWAAWVWRAWNRLTADRPMHQVTVPLPLGKVAYQLRPGRIPYTSIEAYARRRGIAGDDFDMLDRLMGEMDDEYLSWWREQEGGQ